MTAPDEVTAGMAAAVAKLYTHAVLDEARAAAAKYLAELDEIKRKYDREFTPGPDQFRYLMAMADEIRSGASP